MAPRKMEIRALSDTDLYLYCIDDFLSPRECTHLIRSAQQKGLAKGAFSSDYKQEKKIEGDTSAFSRLANDASKTVQAINRRMERLTCLPAENGGQLMLISYGTGGQFFPHFDFHKEGEMGDRIVQMLLYLNDVEQGGETSFPQKGIAVRPKRGRALLWYNVQGMALPSPGSRDPGIPSELVNNKFSLHTGHPVIRGEKWIASKTFHPVSIDGAAD